MLYALYSHRYRLLLTSAVLTFILVVSLTLAHLPAMASMPAAAPNRMPAAAQVTDATLSAANVPSFLVGINKPSLEYSCHGSHITQADFTLMRTVWHANAVRLPLSSAEWLNQGGICPTYHATVEHAVQAALAAGLYVIVALAWTNPFHTTCAPHFNPAGEGYPLPSVADATAFWTSVATDFTAQHSWRIGYEVYGEPHDLTMRQWHDGGTVTVPVGRDRCAGSYTAMGMQALATLVTSIVGWHRVYVSGNQWAGDLSAPLAGFPITTGKARVYDLHLYPGPNSGSPSNWPVRFATLAQTQPVVATEFGDFPHGGCADVGAFNTVSMPYLAAHLRGMFAWAWNTDPCGLITNYATGAPSAYGAGIQAFYTRLTGTCAVP